MRVLVALAILASTLAILPTGSASAGCAVNENFDSYSGGQTLWAPMDVGPFRILRSSVDTVGTAGWNELAIHGTSLDLDGSYGGALLATPDLNLPAGNHAISFWIQGSQRGDTNTMTVSLGPYYSEDFTLASAAAPQEILRVVTIPAGAPAVQLAFDHEGSDAFGIILDDVSVCSVAMAPPVPELATFTLVGVGTVGVAAVVFARRA